ncbi:MAG: tetrahydromethanopterin S-methyltransferase subunit H [Candidatus Bathyarchaeia archaeon]
MTTIPTTPKSYEIGGCEIGGAPGQLPTCLIGSIFYANQKIHIDEKAGTFKKEEAERLINLQQEFSDKTGNPHMFDVVGSTQEALIKHIEFVSTLTEAPLLLDGITSEIRINALRQLPKLGVKNPIIYNSITPDFKLEELAAIEEAGIESAVLLTFNTRDFTSKGRVNAAKELLAKTAKTITKPLVDTAVLDIPTLGIACKAISVVKEETGVPCGAGVHNAIETWRGLSTKLGLQAKKPAMASAAAMAVSMGADFILYGPLEAADVIFPTVAMVDAAIGQLSFESGSPPKKPHPLFKIA